MGTTIFATQHKFLQAESMAFSLGRQFTNPIIFRVRRQFCWRYGPQFVDGGDAALSGRMVDTTSLLLVTPHPFDALDLAKYMWAIKPTHPGSSAPTAT